MIKQWVAVSMAVACLGGAAGAGADPVTTSREYKLMLNPSLFASNADLAAASYWDALEYLIENGSIQRPASGDLDDVTTIRTVRFFDTPGTCVLRNSGYSFRERVEDGDREVTLKFRSPDRFISAKRDVDGDDAAAVTKLEEDISAPFRSVYSHSSTAPIGAGKNLNKMDDPVGLFPGLAEMNFDEDDDIAIVGGLSVHEEVYKGATVDLGAQTGEFSLTVWYATSGSSTPLLVEASFKYEEDDADYTEPVVNRAKQLFEAMQGMTAWVAPSALLKTTFVYEYDPDFCQ